MRRALAGLVVVLLMAPALAAVGTEYEDYRDTFDGGGYSGNDGSLDFNGPWTESGDPGGGGAGGGWIHVGPEGCSGKCLHIDGYGLVLAPYSVERKADLSLFEVAELCYDLTVDPQGLTTTELQVQVKKGSTWHTVKTHDLSKETETSVMIPISDYMTEGFRVRFVVPDLLSGGLLGLDILYDGYATLDNVTVRGIVESEATTTTSTTSTTTSSTTSTTTPKTTTTTERPSTPTTAGQTPATPTTRPGDTDTSVTAAEPDSSGDTVPTTMASDTTTTTTSSTSTTLFGTGSGPAGPPPNSGLREPAVGLLADYRSGGIGSLDTDPIEVLGVELDVDFSLAVEVFEAARLWIVILVLLITAALVSGMDRRRTTRSTP